MTTTDLREKINGILDDMKQEINDQWGVHDSGSFNAVDSEVYASDAIMSLVTTDTIAMLQYLKSKQFHGSHCIDDECEDEQHGYDAVHVDYIDDMLDSLTPNTKKGK